MCLGTQSFQCADAALCFLAIIPSLAKLAHWKCYVPKDLQWVANGYDPFAPLKNFNSQAFDNRQSRRTVSGETCKASAISASFNPPKNRNSTTLLLRSS